MMKLATVVALMVVLSGCLPKETFAETCSRLETDLFGAASWSDGSFTFGDAADVWRAVGCVDVGAR